MNQNLVPELRTDKNGVVSKRWVRPAGVSAASKSQVPQPKMQSKPVSKEEIDVLSNEIYEVINGNGKYDSVLFNDIQRSLLSYTPQTINKLRMRFDDHSSGFRYSGGFHHTVAEMIDLGASDSLINDFLKYPPQRRQKTSIIALHYYRESHGIAFEPSGEADPRVIALKDTAESVKLAVRNSGKPKDTFWIPVIQDERLIHLVLDRLDDNERINEIIIERSTDDYETIILALDAPVKSLSKGAL